LTNKWAKDIVRALEDVMTNCEECGKKLPKRKKGPGKPRRFCTQSCARKNWERAHPRVRVYQEA